MSAIDNTNGAPPPPASPRQFLLGAFILFQLAFLLVSNLLGYIKWAPSSDADAPKQYRNLVNRVAPQFANKEGHGWHWGEQVEMNILRWTQLTGQDQQWSLFAPTVAQATGFPCVLLIWDEPSAQQPMLPGTMFAYNDKNGIHLCAPWDPPQREPSLSTARHLGLLAATSPWEAVHLHALRQFQEDQPMPRMQMLISENEPADIHNYLRLGNCRVRRYEGQVYLNLQPNDNETPEDLAARMTRRTRRLVNDYHDVTKAYMDWRLKAWKKEHKDEPGPKQVILLHRCYRIHGPETDDNGNVKEQRGWDRGVLWPLARWQPNHPNPNMSGMVLEYYDYTDRRFVPIR